MSVDDVTSCGGGASLSPLIAAVSADRHSRSVDSGLVTDVDPPQRTVTAVSGGVTVGSCDSGLSQRVELDSQQCDVHGTDQLVTDRDTRQYDCDRRVTLTTNRQSWLLRLFESRLFDMSIAIQYLFNSKETGVQAYIGESVLLTVTVVCQLI